MTDSPPLTRRRFLGLGLGAACSCFFPFPALAAGGKYVQANQPRLLAEFAGVCQGVAAIMAPRLGADAAKTLAGDCRARFAALLPGLPDLGPDNRNQDNLVQALWLTAMYQAMQPRGLAAADAGRALYDLCRASLDETPGAELAARGEWYFSAENVAGMQAWAARTRARTFAGDWVATVLVGDGKDFDLGHDYAQCGALTYFISQGAAEVAPYFCLNDFILSRAEGTGLSRAHTLAQGHDRCDFRYKKGREVTQDWDTETPKFARNTP